MLFFLRDHLPQVLACDIGRLLNVLGGHELALIGLVGGSDADVQFLEVVFDLALHGDGLFAHCIVLDLEQLRGQVLLLLGNELFGLGNLFGLELVVLHLGFDQLLDFVFQHLVPLFTLVSRGLLHVFGQGR